MNFTINQLKIYLQVVESESITMAAEALFLTQPAVSIQLKKFQEQFAIPLTEVVGRRLFITEFGREIAKAAEKILLEIESITYQSMTYEKLLAGKLKISVASTGKYVMPYFLSGFMNDHKGIDLIMDVTNKTLVVKSLENNEVDFALVSTIPKDLKANQLSLLQNKLYLVGSTMFKSDRKKSIREILKKYPLLFREPGSATRNAMEEFIIKKDLPVFKKIELTSNEAVKQSVIAGLGYSIMPLIGLRDALKNEELEIIPIRGLPIISTWNLIWLKSKKLSHVANALLEYLQEEKERIIKETFSWYEAY
jgi:DNA-binding transcriptional LysR family regulator